MSVDAQDAVGFLQKQHQDVRNIFEQFERDGLDQETFDTLVRMLAVHETAEEMVVYPALRVAVPGGNEIVQAVTAEEDQAKKALVDLEEMGVDDPGFHAAMTAFSQMVLAHAEHEEREVFPALREHLEQGTLDAMRAGLIAAETAAPTHPHKLAPESAIGNLAIGPFVAVVDRVRDAIKAVTS